MRPPPAPRKPARPKFYYLPRQKIERACKNRPPPPRRHPSKPSEVCPCVGGKVGVRVCPGTGTSAQRASRGAQRHRAICARWQGRRITVCAEGATRDRAYRGHAVHPPSMPCTHSIGGGVVFSTETFLYGKFGTGPATNPCPIQGGQGSWNNHAAEHCAAGLELNCSAMRP